MSSDIWLHFSILLSVFLCLGFAVSHWFLSNSGKGCFVADPWQRKLFLFYQRWSVLIAWNPIRSKGWILSTFSRSYRYTENSAKLISDALMCLMHLRKVLMKRLSGLLKVCSVSPRRTLTHPHAVLTFSCHHSFRVSYFTEFKTLIWCLWFVFKERIHSRLEACE